MIPALISVVLLVLNLIIVVLIVNVVLSWLYTFEMITRRSPIVDTLWRFTNAICEPLLRPIRRVIPPVANVDLSPLVLILLIVLLRQLLPAILLGQLW